MTQLIKLGKLKRNEMEKAMHMLLPGKSQEEIAELLNKIIGEDTDESETRQVKYVIFLIMKYILAYWKHICMIGIFIAKLLLEIEK